MEKENHIPLYILEQCSNIKVIYQNKVWEKIKESESAFPNEITTQTCLEVLEKMYDYYNWGEEESKGRNPMVKQRTRLQYFAVLMYSWMRSTPLNMMIIYIIIYLRKFALIIFIYITIQEWDSIKCMIALKTADALIRIIN